MGVKLPTLAILPLHSLIIHEHHDASRSGPLKERIRTAEVFTNPVVVAPLHDHTARYVVLDGANRTTVTRELGLDHILAQVVHHDELGFETQTWNHVVWGLEPEAFLQGLRSVPDLEFREVDETGAYRGVIHEQGLAAVHLPDGRVYEIRCPPAGIIERNRLLNAIVDTYKDRAQLDRTNQRSIEPLKKLYNDLSGLVFMPKLRIRHIISLVSRGHLLPAGVTRFTISPRALRVNFPMEILRSDRSLEEKNDLLGAFIKDRLARKGVRYYAEETVLYDE